mmetsp:Transcript_16174/g.50812  ORF Transcript_16174/g.50812 Transcript_16174/m.50812 type:complete len:273 (+) Transcript_16174:929-1747(+)
MAALRPALLPRRTSAFLGGLPRGLHRDGKRVPHARRQEGEPRASPRGPGLDNAVRGSYIPGRGMRIGKDGGVHAARAPRVRQLGVPLLQGHAHAPHPRELQVLQRRRDADRRPDARADHALRADLRHQPGDQALGHHGAAVLRGDTDPLRHHPRLVRHGRAHHECSMGAEPTSGECRDRRDSQKGAEEGKEGIPTLHSVCLVLRRELRMGRGLALEGFEDLQRHRPQRRAAHRHVGHGIGLHRDVIRASLQMTLQTLAMGSGSQFFPKQCLH